MGPQHSHALRLPGASAEAGDGEQRQPAGDRPDEEHQERCGEVDYSLCHGIQVICQIAGDNLLSVCGSDLSLLESHFLPAENLDIW